MAKKKKKAVKKANPEFKYSFPELENEVLPTEEAVARRKLKVMRYWCFRFMNEAEAMMTGNVERYDHMVEENKGAPKGLKKYVESLPGFGEWSRFGTSWDLRGSNPFFTVYRMLSLWKEWDYIMERVAVPIDAPPAEILARVKMLEKDYIESNYDSTV